MQPVRHIPKFVPVGSIADYSIDETWGNEDHFRVTVLFSTNEATLAALKTAGSLARNLGARILLVVPQVVPSHLPVEEPPVAVQFVEKRLLALVAASGLDADEIGIAIYLCRSRKECLRTVLKASSLVVIGGRSRWRLSKEQVLRRYLHALGHHVIFAELETKGHERSLLHLDLRGLFRRVLGLYQGL